MEFYGWLGSKNWFRVCSTQFLATNLSVFPEVGTCAAGRNGPQVCIENVVWLPERLQESKVQLGSQKPNAKCKITLLDWMFWMLELWELSCSPGTALLRSKWSWGINRSTPFQAETTMSHQREQCHSCGFVPTRKRHWNTHFYKWLQHVGLEVGQYIGDQKMLQTLQAAAIVCRDSGPRCITVPGRTLALRALTSSDLTCSGLWTNLQWAIISTDDWCMCVCIILYYLYIYIYIYI